MKFLGQSVVQLSIDSDNNDKRCFDRPQSTDDERPAPIGYQSSSRPQRAFSRDHTGRDGHCKEVQRGVANARTSQIYFATRRPGLKPVTMRKMKNHRLVRMKNDVILRQINDRERMLARHLRMCIIEWCT